MKNKEYVPLGVNYKSGNYKGGYCIEVVHKDFFKEYLKIIEKDQEILKNRANKHAVEYLEELKESMKKYFSTKNL